MEQAPVSLGGKIMKNFYFQDWRTLLLLFVLVQRKLKPLMIFDCLDHFPFALSDLLRRIVTIVLIKLAIWNLCVTSSRTSAAPSLQETTPSKVKIAQRPVSQFSNLCLSFRLIRLRRNGVLSTTASLKMTNRLVMIAKSSSQNLIVCGL